MRLNDHGECRVEIKRLREKNAKLQAECAAMRDALLEVKAGRLDYESLLYDFDNRVREVAAKVLASDAGAKMLEYVELLEQALLLGTTKAERARAIALKRELGRG